MCLYGDFELQISKVRGNISNAGNYNEMTFGSAGMHCYLFLGPQTTVLLTKGVYFMCLFGISSL